MKNLNKIFCVCVLFWMSSCANKIASSQPNYNYENPDVVTDGYTKESSRNKTSSSNSVDSQNTIVGLDVYLRSLPGLTVTGDGSNAQVLVHGVGSLLSSNEPLFVIDNVPINGGYASAYQTINSAEIKRVSVLKDAASSAIYGSRGGNGVILITRKKANH